MSKFDYEIDRMSPALLPSGPVVMRQNWRNLLFLHWEVPMESLRQLVPPELEIDTFDGKAYVGLVPFSMRDIRPRGLPAVSFLSHFNEVNVRTYVHFRGCDPGVWFFSLDAANPVAVQIARGLFKLPYFYAVMESKISGSECTYSSERLWPKPIPASCELKYAPAGSVVHAVPGSLDHFLVERYILYSMSGRNLFQGRVHHTPYGVQSAELISMTENLVLRSGIVLPDASPLVHYSAGVDVRVYGIKRV